MAKNKGAGVLALLRRMRSGFERLSGVRGGLLGLLAATLLVATPAHAVLKVLKGQALGDVGFDPTGMVLIDRTTGAVAEQTYGPLTVPVGQSTVTYIITIFGEPGGPSYDAVTISDKIPMYLPGTVITAEATPTSSGHTDGVCAVAGDTVTCSYGTIDPGEDGTFFIRVRRPMAVGTFTNTVTVPGHMADVDPVLSHFSVDTTIVGGADVELVSKTVAPSPVLAGTAATYTITYRNNGTIAAEGVEINDVFATAAGDAGFTVTSAVASAGSCTVTAGTNAVKCTIGTVAPGATGTVTVSVVPSAMTAPPVPRTLANTASISSTNADDVPTNNTKSATLTVVDAGAISGSVYIDSNNDGIRQPTEGGIAGIPLTLTGCNSLGDAVTRTVTTGADGSYTFAGLLPSGTAPLCAVIGYTITQGAVPAPYTDGKDTAGTLGGVVGAEAISGIVLPAGISGGGYNFGEQAIGVLSGVVYRDDNRNNVRDSAERGIPGVTITLLSAAGAAVVDADGNPVTPKTTDANGAYVFVNLAPGTYTIVETQPANFTDGAETVGTLGGSSAVNDRFTGVVLPVGGAGTGYNFGEIANAGTISGRVWLDSNHNRVDDEPTSNGRAGWIVELVKPTNPALCNGGYTRIAQTTTDASGNYSFGAVTPNVVGDAADRYEIIFRHPTSGAVFGRARSREPGVDLACGTIRNLLVSPGTSIAQQDLPLDPMGVVYSAVGRTPVPGAVVSISGPAGYSAGSHLVGGSGNAAQRTGADGMYQFQLLSSAPAGTYTLTVTAPTGFLPAPSALIAPCNNALLVTATPDPALVQTSNTAPTSAAAPHNPAACPASSAALAAAAGTTQYFYAFSLSATSANVANNHIPLDPSGGPLTLAKTTPKVNVVRSEMVPYSITATNSGPFTLSAISIRDQMPPGFKYRAGTATLNGVPVEPVITGRDLVWPNQNFAPGEQKVLKMLLMVGTGVSEGEYINQVWAATAAGVVRSNVATASVRIIPDHVFDCGDVIGKVFDDRNANGYQDEGEGGVPNVRVVTARGLLVTSDAEGRFHVPCAAVPNASRGSNFIMKLDERTLPTGYRVTTENPRVVLLTRGKMTKLNFGATIHRVVRLEVTDAAFEPGSNRLKADWQTRVEKLPDQLRERPSVVRVAYYRGADGETVAKARTEALIQDIRSRWEAQQCCYMLVVEEEKTGVSK